MFIVAELAEGSEEAEEPPEPARSLVEVVGESMSRVAYANIQILSNGRKSVVTVSIWDRDLIDVDLNGEVLVLFSERQHLLCDLVADCLELRFAVFEVLIGERCCVRRGQFE